jgi:hypothetical protein
MAWRLLLRYEASSTLPCFRPYYPILHYRLLQVRHQGLPGIMAPLFPMVLAPPDVTKTPPTNLGAMSYSTRGNHLSPPNVGIGLARINYAPLHLTKFSPLVSRECFKYRQGGGGDHRI